MRETPIAERLLPLDEIFENITDLSVKRSLRQAYRDMSDPKSELQIGTENAIMIYDAPAGAKMHHWWRGGLFEHLTEMWEFSKMVYWNTIQIQKLDFTLSDLAVLILVHDLSKGIAFQKLIPKKGISVYQFEYRPGFFGQMGYDHKTAMLLSHYAIKLTEPQYIAFIHTEGGWAEAAQGGRKDGNMLAKFMHIADMHSSQILGGKWMPVGLGLEVSSSTPIPIGEVAEAA